MWMCDFAMKFYLTLNKLSLVLWGDVSEADDFDGVVFVGSCVNGKFNDSEWAISEFFLLKDVEFFDGFEMTFGNNFHRTDWVSL